MLVVAQTDALKILATKLRKVLANSEKMTANPEMFGGDLFLRKLVPQLQFETIWSKSKQRKPRLSDTWTSSNYSHLSIGKSQKKYGSQKTEVADGPLPGPWAKRDQQNGKMSPKNIGCLDLSCTCKSKNDAPNPPKKLIEQHGYFLIKTVQHWLMLACCHAAWADSGGRSGCPDESHVSCFRYVQIVILENCCDFSKRLGMCCLATLYMYIYILKTVAH